MINTNYRFCKFKQKTSDKYSRKRQKNENETTGIKIAFKHKLRMFHKEINENLVISWLTLD